MFGVEPSVNHHLPDGYRHPVMALTEKIFRSAAVIAVVDYLAFLTLNAHAFFDSGGVLTQV